MEPMDGLFPVLVLWSPDLEMWNSEHQTEGLQLQHQNSNLTDFFYFGAKACLILKADLDLGFSAGVL